MQLGILGDPVEHSLSPRMHQAALRARGIEGRYLLLATPPERLPARIEEVRARFRGVNVTVPLKERVLAHLDLLSPAAEAIGAVNTVINEGGRLLGENTDAAGFLKSLEEAGVTGERAFVLGAGGAARAVVYALKTAGFEVDLYNRTRARAEALARAFGARVTELSEARGADLVVNATSVGLADPGATPLPAEFFPERGFAVDLVYRPRKTRFLREAEARGLTPVDGVGMLLWQGALAFELWTGEEAPIEVMRRVLDDALGAAS